MTVRRECCNYCMWYGPTNADGTMRKHRPATREDKWGKPNKVQDMTAKPCPGSHQPYARFGTVEEATEDAQETTVTDATNADEYKPSREAAIEAARIALAELKTKGWKANPVYWVGRLEAALEQTLKAIDKAEETETEPRFTVLNAGHVFAVRDTTTGLDVATKTSRSGAQHIADCLRDGTMVLDSLGKAVPAQKPVVKASTNTADYGVFEDGECIETGFHGDLGRAAAEATVKAYTDDPTRDELTYEVKELCPEHDEQPKDTCEECHAEADEERDEAEESTEPTLEDYSAAARHIEQLMPGRGRRSR
ncbi:MAG: hypothetical protein HOY76_19650 [Streptomyces sp.]|nr:hypothetical protein [Streptomyces sp.]